MVFAGICLAASVARLGILIALHLVPNDRHPIRDAVSDYAVGATARLSAAMSWMGVLVWGSLAFAVWTMVPGWSDHTTATVLLAVLAVLFLALPFAPTDLPGERRTVRGVAHYALAIAWFALSYNLTGNFARLAQGRWDDWLGAVLSGLHWAAAVALVGVVAGLLVPVLRPYFGLVERVFIVVIGVFYLLTAYGLLVSA